MSTTTTTAGATKPANSTTSRKPSTLRTKPTAPQTVSEYDEADTASHIPTTMQSESKSESKSEDEDLETNDYGNYDAPQSFLLPEELDLKYMRREEGTGKRQDHWVYTKPNTEEFGQVYAMPRGWKPSMGINPPTKEIKVTLERGTEVKRNVIA